MPQPKTLDIHPLPWRPHPKSGGFLLDANGVVLARFEARDQWESIDSTNDDMCRMVSEAMNARVHSIDDLQKVVGLWGDRVLPYRTIEGIAFKLIEEALELLRASRGVGATEDELADILILALDIANVAKIDVVRAVLTKMAINNERKWEVRADGTAQHVETP